MPEWLHVYSVVAVVLALVCAVAAVLLRPRRRTWPVPDEQAVSNIIEAERRRVADARADWAANWRQYCFELARDTGMAVLSGALLGLLFGIAVVLHVARSQ